MQSQLCRYKHAKPFEVELVRACEREFPGLQLSSALLLDLASWKSFQDQAAVSLKICLENTPPSQWAQLIQSHSSAHHPWYSFLAHSAGGEVFSSFFKEESEMPAFVPLLENVEAALSVEMAKQAVRENLHDELVPLPHASMFERLVTAVSTRWPNAESATDTFLADTNLVFYFGYFVDPWFAIGSLYATELMVPFRAQNMDKGLKRLGFSHPNRHFMTLHGEADELHAQDWLDKVILPSVQAAPECLGRIASGIAIRLFTSAAYLDRLSAKYQATGIKSCSGAISSVR